MTRIERLVNRMYHKYRKNDVYIIADTQEVATGSPNASESDNGGECAGDSA